MKNKVIDELKIFAKNLTVLVVEDDNSLREEIKELISCFFYKVTTAKDGQEALEKYKSKRFDLVITDLRMPNMDGLELSREIKTINSKQTVMVLSGYIDEFVIELIDIGIDSLVLKPYDFDKFMQKLLKHSENIVLRKDFEKLIVNKSLHNETLELSKKPAKIETTKEIKSIKKDKGFERIDSLASKVAEQKVDFIEEFKQSHITSEDIDKNMWKYISEDIENLNFEFEEVINYILLNGINEDLVRQLAKIFNKYYQNLSLINELHDFATIFLDLSDTFYHDVDLNKLDENKSSIFDTFEFFYEDLTNFFFVVFVNNETENIHYLTDSLKASVTQIKIKLGLEKLEEEDELELF